MFEKLIRVMVVLVSFTVFAQAQDWAQWRGANRDGVV